MPTFADNIQAAMPPEGLFADKDWLLSPEPFPLAPAFVTELEKLGHRLNLFQRASNQLYNLSAQGRQPAWIADYLDRGKPKDLIELSRSKPIREQLPRIIRPDVILTDDGFTIAELDSVPGGIGLTAWLGQTYASLGHDIVGGEKGMLDGFRDILPDGAEILISEESATYRPEMQWLAGQLGDDFSAAAAENQKSKIENRKSIYRFFELFDLPKLPPALVSRASETTPPFKPQLEEKMWLALFWMRPLRDFWRRELGEKHWLELQKHIPQSWILDPSPLPHHAVIPGLEIHDWDELTHFSQKQRDLILKISGFSDRAWGSRGVVLGSDVSQKKWAEAVASALADFEHHPHVLQRFHKGRLVEHPYLDRDTGESRVMQGRVRLCPYYFIIDGKSRLGGVLATICPADKKLIHGMRDAIIVPCAIQP